MTEEKKYPYWHKHHSELAGSKFVGFFQPEEDYALLEKEYPNGCVDIGSMGEYSVFYKGKSIDEWIRTLEGDSMARHIAIDRMKNLEHDNQWQIYDWSDLSFKGYRMVYEPATERLGCTKGKSKANKDTPIVMLSAIPGSVQKARKNLQPYIKGMQLLAKAIEEGDLPPD